MRYVQSYLNLSYFHFLQQVRIYEKLKLYKIYNIYYIKQDKRFLMFIEHERN